MSVRVISNKKNTSFVVHATANGSLTIAGNNSVSNVAISDEILTGATITQAIFGVAPAGDGHVVVKRGANVVAVYDSTGQHDYAGCGMPISRDQTGTLVFEGNATGSWFVMLECQKVTSSNGVSDYFR